MSACRTLLACLVSVDVHRNTGILLLACLTTLVLAAGCNSDNGSEGTAENGEIATTQNDSSLSYTDKRAEDKTDEEATQSDPYSLLSQVTVNTLSNAGDVKTYRGGEARTIAQKIGTSEDIVEVCNNESNIDVYPEGALSFREDNPFMGTAPSQYLAFTTPRHTGWLPLSEYVRFYTPVSLDWASAEASLSTWQRYLAYFNVKVNDAFSNGGCGFLASHRFLKDPVSKERDWGRFVRIMLGENNLYVVATDIDGSIDLVIEYQSDIIEQIVEVSSRSSTSSTTKPDTVASEPTDSNQFDDLSYTSGQWRGSVFSASDTLLVNLSSLIPDGQWSMLKSTITYADTMSVLKYECNSSLPEHNHCGLDKALVDEVEHTTNVVLVGYVVREEAAWFIPFHHAAFDGWPSDASRYLENNSSLEFNKLYKYSI